jgi:hypothetical protein
VTRVEVAGSIVVLRRVEGLSASLAGAGDGGGARNHLERERGQSEEDEGEGGSERSESASSLLPSTCRSSLESERGSRSTRKELTTLPVLQQSSA